MYGLPGYHQNICLNLTFSSRVSGGLSSDHNQKSFSLCSQFQSPIVKLQIDYDWTLIFCFKKLVPREILDIMND